MYDLIIIGAGQAGLASAYYAKKQNLNYIVLDKNNKPGGSWTKTWDSLTLFSMAEHNFLPGWMMPNGSKSYPTRDDVIEYITQYQQKYEFNIQYSTEVIDVIKQDGIFNCITNQGDFDCKHLISATGTWENPFIPKISGKNSFKGIQIHTIDYKNPEPFIGKRTAIIGEGNSAAQILAEVSEHTDTIWITKKKPKFLPDYLNGRDLFDIASAKNKAIQNNEKFEIPDLGSIVMVDSVKRARDRGVFKEYYLSFDKISEGTLIWNDGKEERVDAIIWCTGFKSALNHLKSLKVMDENGRISTHETKSDKVKNLYFVGYGNWTGFASATIIGVGRFAKQVLLDISLKNK